MSDGQEEQPEDLWENDAAHREVVIRRLEQVVPDLEAQTQIEREDAQKAFVDLLGQSHLSEEELIDLLRSMRDTEHAARFRLDTSDPGYQANYDLHTRNAAYLGLGEEMFFPLYLESSLTETDPNQRVVRMSDDPDDPNSAN